MIFLRAAQREFTQNAVAVFVALFAILISTVLIRLLGQAAGGRVPADAVLALIGFGAIAQMPVVLSLLAQAGMVTAAGLKAKRRYAIVLAFVAAAILTPPDVISQIGLAIPIILLYEVSVFAAGLIEKRRAAHAEADTDADSEAQPAADPEGD